MFKHCTLYMLGQSWYVRLGSGEMIPYCLPSIQFVCVGVCLFRNIYVLVCVVRNTCTTYPKKCVCAVRKTIPKENFSKRTCTC